MTLFFIITCCCIAYFAVRWATCAPPPDFKAPEYRPRRTPYDFVRSSFRKLSQRQVRRNDRRLFAAGNKHAFA